MSFSLTLTLTPHTSQYDRGKRWFFFLGTCTYNIRPARMCPLYERLHILCTIQRLLHQFSNAASIWSQQLYSSVVKWARGSLNGGQVEESQPGCIDLYILHEVVRGGHSVRRHMIQECGCGGVCFVNVTQLLSPQSLTHYVSLQGEGWMLKVTLVQGSHVLMKDV